MMRQKRNKNTRERGQAMLEVTLMAPWIFFLFIGILDTGFYSYAAICTQNAARAAAMQTAAAAGAQSDTIACLAALSELSLLPNVTVNLTTCAANKAAITAAKPVAVERKKLCGEDVDTGKNKKCNGGGGPTEPPFAGCCVGVGVKRESSPWGRKEPNDKERE